MWGREQAWSTRSDEIPQELQAWASVVDISRLSERTAHRADEYLRTYRHTNWFARREEAARLMSVIASEVEPPPPLTLNPLDVFATVLAIRNERGDTTLPRT